MTDENLTLDDIEQDLINQVFSMDAVRSQDYHRNRQPSKTFHQINEKPDPVLVV